MSYYGVTMDMYQTPPAGTPGWNLAAVPGWGINPLRAGPSRVGVGGATIRNDLVLPHYAQLGEEYAGDQYIQYTLGHVAFAGAAGIGLGLLFYHIWKLRQGGK